MNRSDDAMLVRPGTLVRLCGLYREQSDNLPLYRSCDAWGGHAGNFGSDDFAVVLGSLTNKPVEPDLYVSYLFLTSQGVLGWYATHDFSHFEVLAPDSPHPPR